MVVGDDHAVTVSPDLAAVVQGEAAQRIGRAVDVVIQHVHTSTLDGGRGVAIAQRHRPKTFGPSGGPGPRQPHRLFADRIAIRSTEPRPCGGDGRWPAGAWNGFARHRSHGCHGGRFGRHAITARYAGGDQHARARLDPADHEQKAHHRQEHRGKGAAILQQSRRRGSRHEQNVSWWVPSFIRRFDHNVNPVAGKDGFRMFFFWNARIHCRLFGVRVRAPGEPGRHSFSMRPVHVPTQLPGVLKSDGKPSHSKGHSKARLSLATIGLTLEGVRAGENLPCNRSKC